jgi:hypothetical protein
MKLGNVNATQAFLGDESTWSAVQVELIDVHAMWGGRRISVAGTRQVVMQLVQPGMRERRYELELSAAAWRHLLGVFIEHDFVTIEPPERPGIPDEARPQITLVNAVQDRWSVAKWAGVSEGRFEAVYRVLIELERLTQQLEPVYEGPYRLGVVEFGLRRGQSAPNAGA